MPLRTLRTHRDPGNIITATIDARSIVAWRRKLKRDRRVHLATGLLNIFTVGCFIAMGGAAGWAIAAMYSALAIREGDRVKLLTRDLAALGPARMRTLTEKSATR